MYPQYWAFRLTGVAADGELERSLRNFARFGKKRNFDATIVCLCELAGNLARVRRKLLGVADELRQLGFETIEVDVLRTRAVCCRTRKRSRELECQLTDAIT